MQVRDLSVAVRSGGSELPAVGGIDLDIARGEILGLVGESGCGKSITSLALLRLLPDNARITGGSVVFEGQDLRSLDEEAMDGLRGRAVSMIFQDPSAALNPAFRVGTQVAEVLRIHGDLSHQAARRRAVELLERVGISEPARCAAAYPHELSGGMRQRAVIAIAVACRPRLIIADEPTTALDVTVQAQILQLLDELRHEFGTAILLITHDLGVIAETADRVAVMYAGRLVETGAVATLFEAPAHPYTRALLQSTPRLDRPLPPDRMLATIPGTVPTLTDMPSGCRFANRCPEVFGPCSAEPRMIEVRADHHARCWLHDRR